MQYLVVLCCVLAMGLALPECDVYNYDECDNEAMYDREHRTGCRYCRYLDYNEPDCFISKEEWMTRFDENADDEGNMYEEEFVVFWTTTLEMCENEARDAFAMMDSNGDGYVSSTEAEAWFDSIDWDSDGIINQDEFAHDFYMFIYSAISDEECEIGK